MNELEPFIKIALLLWHLRTALREERSELSVDGLVKLLNSAQAGSKRYKFDRRRVDALLAVGNLFLDDEAQAQILHAIQVLVDRCPPNLRFSCLDAVPDWLEKEYKAKLPKVLQEPRTAITLRGEPLEGLANDLHGAWRFFYVSPIDRDGKPNPEIRGFVVHFERADANSTSVELRVISSRGYWRGYAFKNLQHLYMLCTLDDDFETAFFQTNAPNRRDLKMVGIGTALERVTRATIAGVQGFLCFAEKFKDDDPDRSEALSLLFKRASSGEDIPEEERHCLTYKTDAELENNHPEMHRYVHKMKVNDKPFDWLWLYLVYQS